MILNQHIGRVAIVVTCLVLNVQPSYAYLPPTDRQADQLNTESKKIIVSEKDKQEALKYYRRGKKFLTKKKYDEAIEAFTQALTHYPNWTNAKRGLAWARKDKQRQVLKDNSGSSSLHDLVLQAQDQYKLGIKLEEEDRPIEAAAKYKAALRIIPGYPEALAALDRLQISTQQSLGEINSSTIPGKRTSAPSYKLSNPRAVKRHQVAKRIKASSLTSNKARLQARNSSIKEAIKKHYLAGMQAFKSNNFDIAINEFELILEFMPNHNKALYYLNKAKKKLYRQMKDMKATIKRAQDSGDRLTEIKALHAIVNLAPNDQEARQAWERAKQDRVKLVANLYRKGVEAYAQGAYNKALKNWDLVLDLDPSHKKALESINKVREKLELIKNE